MTHDDLLKFCNPCDIRHPLQFVHHDGTNTYCSNGKLAIRIPRVIKGATAVLLGESPVPEIFQKFANNVDEYEYTPLPEIPEAEDCPQCKGTGIQYACTTCNGEGALPPNDADCPKCKGSGFARIKADGKVSGCWHCDGSGNKEHQAVQMPNGQFIARRYLLLLATLPGIAVSTMPRPSTNDLFQHPPLRFTFSGNGEALCMPLLLSGAAT